MQAYLASQAMHTLTIDYVWMCVWCNLHCFVQTLPLSDPPILMDAQTKTVNVNE